MYRRFPNYPVHYRQPGPHPNDQRFFPLAFGALGFLGGLAVSPFLFNRPCCPPYPYYPPPYPPYYPPPYYPSPYGGRP
ncbi:hypothetical protein [Bacillus sp. 2205SS5-2]|uniref:hypothetical protein n=1 Tax=Bacillus sp. 2205SS5-2 TaxID=3109031 RepID=UPI0030042073